MTIDFPSVNRFDSLILAPALRRRFTAEVIRLIRFCRLPAGISVCHRLQSVVDGRTTVFLQPDFSRLLFGEGSRLEARLKEESAFIALQTTG
jgi:hypothetical protein